MDTVYSLEVWVPDGERWRWSAIGDGFHDFLAEEVFANALTGRMRLLREKFGHEGRG